MIMAGHSWKLLVSFVVFLVGLSSGACAAVAPKIMSQINHINSEGQYLGIIVPNSYEMDPLLNSSSFHAHEKFPYLDFAGRRFRLGRVENESVIIVMTGLSMLNAGITTQLLLALFNVKGVLHYGIAGNANPNLQIGDVTIPRYWAHSGLWNWQRFGDGTEDQLALESNGDYTREVGYLNISNYNNGTETENLLNNVWYQPEEIFPVNGTPEVRQHVFWVPVDRHYFALAKKIEGLNLDQCVNSTTCLPRAPIVARVERGMSANVYLDNRAYRQFLYSKFNATPVEMESAAIALVCHQQNMPFITIRALSDLAGGGSALSNEADTFSSLAAKNSVEAVVAFIGLLSS